MTTVSLLLSILNLLILIATVYYIAHAPIDAVRVGRTLNNEQQKDNAKRNLFLTLFALRGSPANYDFVKCLNQIDVVFEDTQTVLDAWHIHYDSLHQTGQVNQIQTWNLQRVNLLSAMATALGYERIRQTDMIREYYPEGHGNQLQDDLMFRETALSFLTNGGLLYKLMIDQINENRQQQDTQKKEA